MKYKKLIFEPVSENNLKLIVELQNQIFPGESAQQNYIETIKQDSYRKELCNWLVFHDVTPIGVVGLYSYHEYPQTAWLGWFGVLPEYRGLGYGSTIFDFWMNSAKDKGYKEARLYTDKHANKDAIEFYKHKGLIEEEYYNEKENSEINNTTLIFSLSLTDQAIEKWNNKFLELTEQLIKQ